MAREKDGLLSPAFVIRRNEPQRFQKGGIRMCMNWVGLAWLVREARLCFVISTPFVTHSLRSCFCVMCYFLYPGRGYSTKHTSREPSVSSPLGPVALPVVDPPRISAEKDRELSASYRQDWTSQNEALIVIFTISSHSARSLRHVTAGSAESLLEPSIEQIRWALITDTKSDGMVDLVRYCNVEPWSQVSNESLALSSTSLAYL